MSKLNKYDRQIRFFGKEGQNRLLQSEVSIIGTGGLGSHVAQQLAYLGVGKINIIDSDSLEETNRNRLVGSFNHHVEGTKKANVIYSLIKMINPEIDIVFSESSVLSRRSANLVSNSKFAFSCLDDDGPRSFVNELVQSFELDCLDIATGIHLEPLKYGGRVIYIDEGGCLSCLNELNQDEIRRYFESTEQRKDRETIYGVNKDELMDSGPSVVSLNGILASIAVLEFMVHITGMRKISKHLYYDGNAGVVRKVTDKPESDCYYCNSIRGKNEMPNYLNN